VWLYKIISNKESFHSYKSKLWAKSYVTFSLEISNYPSILIRSWPMWHYPMCRHYPCVANIPCAALFSYHDVVPITPNLTHISLIWSPILEIFSAMNLPLHFLHIHRFDFYLKKKSLPSNLDKILWSNKFLRVPSCRNYFQWKSRWHLLLMRPWALNLDYMTFPFLHFGIL
jgi:hypothetical protein